MIPSTSIFQGIGSAIQSAEKEERIKSDWNIKTRNERLEIEKRHPLLTHRMLSHYDICLDCLRIASKYCLDCEVSLC